MPGLSSPAIRLRRGSCVVGVSSAVCTCQPPTASMLARFCLPASSSVHAWLLRLRTRSDFAPARLPAPNPVLHVSAPVRRGTVADARLGLARCPISFFFVVSYYETLGTGTVTTCLVAVVYLRSRFHTHPYPIPDRSRFHTLPGPIPGLPSHQPSADAVPSRCMRGGGVPCSSLFCTMRASGLCSACRL